MPSGIKSTARRNDLYSMSSPNFGSHYTIYSTVTLFARLRGWSASLPMKTAV